MTRTMPARYPGTCAETGRRIAPGDLISYDRTTRRTACSAPASANAAAWMAALSTTGTSPPLLLRRRSAERERRLSLLRLRDRRLPPQVGQSRKLVAER